MIVLIVLLEGLLDLDVHEQEQWPGPLQGSWDFCVQVPDCGAVLWQGVHVQALP